MTFIVVIHCTFHCYLKVCGHFIKIRELKILIFLVINNFCFPHLLAEFYVEPPHYSRHYSITYYTSDSDPSYFAHLLLVSCSDPVW